MKFVVYELEETKKGNFIIGCYVKEFDNLTEAEDYVDTIIWSTVIVPRFEFND